MSQRFVTLSVFRLYSEGILTERLKVILQNLQTIHIKDDIMVTFKIIWEPNFNLHLIVG